MCGIEESIRKSVGIGSKMKFDRTKGFDALLHTFFLPFATCFKKLKHSDAFLGF